MTLGPPPPQSEGQTPQGAASRAILLASEAKPQALSSLRSGQPVRLSPLPTMSISRVLGTAGSELRQWLQSPIAVTWRG